MEAQNFEAVVQALREWRQAHPQATFDEIDATVQRHFALVQAQVVAELSQTPPEEEQEREEAAQPAPTPRCPQCGQPAAHAGAWGAPAARADAPGAGDYAASGVLRVPGLRVRAFPPWMRRSAWAAAALAPKS